MSPMVKTGAHPTSDRSFSRLSSAVVRSCCSSFRTVGIGNWKASSHDWKVRGSGASLVIAILVRCEAQRATYSNVYVRGSCSTLARLSQEHLS